jgi:hypothetical protein
MNVSNRIVALSHENAATLDSNVQHAQAPCDLSSPWPGASGGMAHAAHVAAPYHQSVPLIAYLDNIRTNS